MTDKTDIKELAVAAWRLEKWLNNLKSDRKLAAKSALRSIKRYITNSGIEIKDPLGSRFDPGLAVEVVNNEASSENEENLIITETLSPYIYQHGKLIQHARVIIGSDGTTGKSEHRSDDESNSESSHEITTKAEKNGINSHDAPDNSKCETDKEITISADDIERVMAYAKIL